MLGCEQVRDMIQSLGGKRRSIIYPVEIEEEQQGRDRCHQIKKQIWVCVKRKPEISDNTHGENWTFDVLFMSLNFFV